MSEVFYDRSVRKGTVKSVFAHLDSLVYAIDALKKDGVSTEDMVVTTPLPRHDVEHALYAGKAPSPVRWFTLFGALFGGSFGFSLCSITHLNWAMILPAGKPVVSIPAFIVITFESTVLWGCLFTLAGLLYHCRLPAKLQIEVQDPRFCDDKFGLILNNLDEDRAVRAHQILEKNGSLEATNGFEDSSAKAVMAPEPKNARWKLNPLDLSKIMVGTTAFVLASLFCIRFYFDRVDTDHVAENGYSYSQSEAAPSYRTAK
jgi:hypothetical protein